MSISRRFSARALSPSIPGRFVLDMLEGYRYKGRNVEGLLQREGLSSERLMISGYRISVSTYVDLLRAAAEELEDEALGFLDNPLPLRSYAVFCSGLSGKQSLAEVLVFYERFYSLFSDQFRFSGNHGEEGYVIAIEFEETGDLEYRFIYISLLLTMVRLIGWLLGIKLLPLSASFSFTARDYEQEHMGYLFDCPIHYGQSRNEIVIPRELVDAPISVTLDLVDIMLRESRFTLLITERGNPFSLAVKKQLVMSKGQDWPEVDAVAQSMNMTPNLLWRKLKKEGTTFSKIRDELKRDWALQLVQDQSLLVEDIAEILRFSDASALQKAFRKWTGATVGHYRERLRNTEISS